MEMGHNGVRRNGWVGMGEQDNGGSMESND